MSVWSSTAIWVVRLVRRDSSRIAARPTSRTENSCRYALPSCATRKSSRQPWPSAVGATNPRFSSTLSRSATLVRGAPSICASSRPVRPFWPRSTRNMSRSRALPAVRAIARPSPTGRDDSTAMRRISVALDGIPSWRAACARFDGGGNKLRPLALLATASLLFAACTQTPAASSPTPTASQSTAPTATAQAQPFAGVTVRVVTFTGPQIAEPLQRRAPDFNKLTGAKVEVITVPFSDLYQKILTDFATKTNSYDAIVFAPQWMGDYVPAGYLEDLSDRVKADTALQWNDIAPFFRDFSATYQGKVYSVPLDGDFQMAYYRSDILAKDGVKPPETWEDFLAIAKQYQGKDLNGDGKADYGSCVAMKRSAQSYWMFISVAGAYIQSQGTGQGAFFNTDNMQPLLAPNEATAAALDVYKSISKLGPPDQLNLDVGDTRGLFTSGRSALSIDWGDIGTPAIDPTTSTVQDQVDSLLLAGSQR